MRCSGLSPRNAEELAPRPPILTSLRAQQPQAQSLMTHGEVSIPRLEPLMSIALEHRASS